jgi:hypothetical protein
MTSRPDRRGTSRPPRGRVTPYSHPCAARGVGREYPQRRTHDRLTFKTVANAARWKACVLSIVRGPGGRAPASRQGAQCSRRSARRVVHWSITADRAAGTRDLGDRNGTAASTSRGIATIWPCENFDVLCWGDVIAPTCPGKRRSLVGGAYAPCRYPAA